jgi:transcriptional regulator with XRE-family HTH domain
MNKRVVKIPIELMEADELAVEVGLDVKLTRVARQWRQEDLARSSGLSLQAIKNLEAGRNVEFKTFLKVMKALGFAHVLRDGLAPQPKTLDELERIEQARTGA